MNSNIYFKNFFKYLDNFKDILCLVKICRKTLIDYHELTNSSVYDEDVINVIFEIINIICGSKFSSLKTEIIINNKYIYNGLNTIEAIYKHKTGNEHINIRFVYCILTKKIVSKMIATSQEHKNVYLEYNNNKKMYRILNTYINNKIRYQNISDFHGEYREEIYECDSNSNYIYNLKTQKKNYIQEIVYNDKLNYCYNNNNLFILLKEVKKFILSILINKPKYIKLVDKTRLFSKFIRPTLYTLLVNNITDEVVLIDNRGVKYNHLPIKWKDDFITKTITGIIITFDSYTINL